MDNNITTTTPTPLNPARHAIKAVLLVILFFGTLLAGTASFPLRKFVVNHRAHSPFLPRLFSLISCFGAGVFLATCLLDLLPDAIASVSKAEKHMGHSIEFPLPAFCISVGFLLVMLLEQMVLHAHERSWIGGADILNHHSNQQSANAGSLNSQGNLAADETTNGTNDEEHLYGSDIGEQHSTMRVLLLVFALSLHAVFEGLSVGMISDVSVLLQIFAALLIHKSIVGFSLGVRLVQSRLRPFTIVLCCTIFAGQVLIGGFIGLGIVDVLTGRASMFLISGILQAIACGTFLYITAFEVLPHELAHGHNSRPLKMLVLIAGFALITGFVALFPDADAD